MAETLNEKYKALVTDNSGTINQMYDASRASTLSGLESAYNQNLSNAEAQRGQIDKQYNQAANDLGVQYERNRRNNNIMAAGNGLNVGTGSQMALAQAGQYQRDFGTLRGQQAAAQTEQGRRIDDLKAQYASQVQQAIAENDLARATALAQEANNMTNQLAKAYQMQYQEEQDALTRQRQAEMDAYNREQDALKWQYQQQQDEYNRQANAAQLLASIGDFSGYASLFGLSNDQAGQLRAQWMASNPDSAYNSGMMTAEQYRAITGKYPAGYTPSGGGGSGANINRSYYSQKVLGNDVINAAATGGNVEAAYNNYVQQYGTPSKDTTDAWARKGLVINPG